MPQARVEFIVEPFEEGKLGPHVTAAIDAANSAGLATDVGPFGTSAHGDVAAVLDALPAIVTASMDQGASRISVQLTVVAE